jgi:hypothetical protein
MANIIDVEPAEARDWLKSKPSWEFSGKINQISNEKMLEFVDTLYKAGCELVLISDYEWEIEPVYEGDEFRPNMLIIKLPIKAQERQVVFNIVNTSFPELRAKILYKDAGSEKIWYFFEPDPQKITVGGKEITWYS